LGIALMLAAISVLSVTDMTQKLLTAELPPAQVMWMRFVFYLPALLPLVLMQPRRLVSAWPRMQAGRGVLFLCSTLLTTFAIAQLPLAEITTIGFAAPLVTTIMSVVFLHEKVGIRRWCAILVGFVGVLIVVRPGGAAFGWPAALVLIGTVAWSLAVVITRRIGAQDGAITTLCWTTGVCLIAGAAAAAPVWVWPAGWLWPILAFNGLGNLFGHYLIIRAIERAAASIVIPFTYFQLGWAVLWGWLVFQAVPDGGTVLGAAVIIASGIYIWHRERVRAAERRAGR